MLIPSIDLLGGQIVQLVQGEKLRLAFDDFEYWIERFSNYPLVQLIDLDAAMRQGDNTELVEQICKRLPCQVGGGIVTVQRAQSVLSAGARRVFERGKVRRIGQPAPRIWYDRVYWIRKRIYPGREIDPRELEAPREIHRCPAAEERKDLIEDLNEDGLSDPQHPAPEDMPVILNRIQLIEQLAPDSMDQVNAAAFAEAYKDLVNLAKGRPAD